MIAFTKKWLISGRVMSNFFRKVVISWGLGSLWPVKIVFLVASINIKKVKIKGTLSNIFLFPKFVPCSYSILSVFEI